MITPGPWVAEQQLDKRGQSLGWIINHANGRIGWSCYATRKPNDGEDKPHPIGGANAKLIASAPELLAILQRYVNAYPAFRMKPIGAPNSEKRIEQENLMNLEDAARAAIAKATS